MMLVKPLEKGFISQGGPFRLKLCLSAVVRSKTEWQHNKDMQLNG